jgi:hypothetical protein
VAGCFVGVQQSRVGGVCRHQLQGLVVELHGLVILPLGKAAVAVGLELGQGLGSLQEVGQKLPSHSRPAAAPVHPDASHHHVHPHSREERPSPSLLVAKRRSGLWLRCMRVAPGIPIARSAAHLSSRRRLGGSAFRHLWV